MCGNTQIPASSMKKAIARLSKRSMDTNRTGFETQFHVRNRNSQPHYCAGKTQLDSIEHVMSRARASVLLRGVSGGEIPPFLRLLFANIPFQFNSFSKICMYRSQSRSPQSLLTSNGPLLPPTLTKTEPQISYHVRIDHLHTFQTANEELQNYSCFCRNS